MLFSRWASSCELARFAHLMVISWFIIGAILRYTANCSFIISCIILSRFRRLAHDLVHEPRDKPGWAEPLNRPNDHRKEPKFTWPRWLCSATNLADAILCYEKAGTRSFQQTDRALIEQIVQEYLEKQSMRRTPDLQKEESYISSPPIDLIASALADFRG